MFHETVVFVETLQENNFHIFSKLSDNCEHVWN